MNDKEWLDKVSTAYKVYPYSNYKVAEFIAWLYKQYGIVPPEEKQGNKDIL